MPRPPSDRVRKNFRLDPQAIATAQTALGARTETETIEQALRLVTGDAPFDLWPRGAPDVPAAQRGVGKGILAFAGALPERDAEEMLAAIEDGCEQVDD